MKYILFITIGLSFFSCQQTSTEVTEAELWGRETVSTAMPEFATTINADQSRTYFNRTAPDRSTMQIMYVDMLDDKWSDAMTLSFSTGQYRDVDPFLQSGGQRLYFSSNRPAGMDTLPGQFNTWYVDKTDNHWSAPILAGTPLNSDSTEIFVTLSKNGNAYFVSERDGDRGIVVSRFEQGKYQAVEKVRPTLRGEAIYASNPCIASDESFLIVSARDPLGNGTPDLFVTINVDGKWSELINLGPKVNSEYADFAPGLSKDDKTLFFTSERPGIVPAQPEGVRPPGDIYKVNLKAILAELE